MGDVQEHLIIMTHSLNSGPVQFFIGLNFANSLVHLGVKTSIFMARAGIKSVSKEVRTPEKNAELSQKALEHMISFLDAGGECFICSTCFDDVVEDFSHGDGSAKDFIEKAQKMGFVEMIECSFNSKVITF